MSLAVSNENAYYSLSSDAHAERVEGKHRFTVAITGPHSELARQCREVESEVFYEKFGNDEELLREEYGPYEDRSRFICVLDQDEVVGVLRVIEGERPFDFKAAADLPEIGGLPFEVGDDQIDQLHPGFESSKTWEVGTLAVRKSHRGQKFRDVSHPTSLLGIKVSHMLYHQLYQQSKENGIDHWIMMIDTRAKAQLAAAGIPVESFCGLRPREYIGSELTHPGYVNVKDVPDKVRSKSLMNFLVLAKGLGITAISKKRVF